MFEQAFRNIDDVLRKEAGCTTELDYTIRMLKAPGRGAVVIKNTFLSNTDNASVSLRKHLLESCNLQLIRAAHATVARGVDLVQVHTNFEIGRRIVEQEQRGKGRAAYGEEVIGALAERLTAEFGKGFSASNLTYMRSFYLLYRERAPILQSATGKLHPGKNLQSVTGKSAVAQRRPFTLSRIVPMSAVLSEQPRNGWSPPKAYQTDSGTPVLTLSAVTGFEYDGSRTKLSSAPTREDAHYWLKPGELLITRSNTRDLVGHVAIYDGTPEKAICCDLIMKMTVDPSKALSRFIYFYLRSPSARSYLTSHAQGANPTMVKIGKQVVQNIAFPLPPLTRQKTIIAILDAVKEKTQRLASIYQQKLAALDELKKSLLHQAFSGEL